MNQFESMTAKYFKLRQTKNIEGLSKLFDDSILLVASLHAVTKNNTDTRSTTFFMFIL